MCNLNPLPSGGKDSRVRMVLLYPEPGKPGTYCRMNSPFPSLAAALAFRASSPDLRMGSGRVENMDGELIMTLPAEEVIKTSAVH